MKDELEKEITDSCPKLFRSFWEERQKLNDQWAAKGREPFHPIAFGFECGGGWFPILKELCLKIEALINTLPLDEQQNFHVAQVKEKFGGLRFYMHGETDEMSKLIREAEEKCDSTCETCSAPSIQLGQGWIVNACRPCWVKYAVGHSYRYDTDEESQGKYYDDTVKRINKRKTALARVNKLRTSKGLEIRHY